MNEWQMAQRLYKREMEGLKVGTRVRLNFLHKPEGIVVEVQQPFGLLAAHFRCQWDDGDESGWLNASDLTIIG